MARKHIFPSQIPEHIDRDPQYRAEKEVFLALDKQLKDSDEDLVVFYDNSWIEEDEKDRQSDFICLHKKLGVLILEVKGGYISAENNEWFSTTISGKSKSKLKEPPINQARRNKYALRDLVYKKITKRNKNLNTNNLNINFTEITFFSDTKKIKQLTKRAESSHFFYKEDLENLVSKILLQLVKTSDAYNYHQPGNDVFKILLDLFSFDFDSLEGGVNYIDLVNRVIKDKETYLDRYIEITKDVPNGIFRGGAGTGKTYLATKKAKQLAKENKSVLYLCSNPSLRKYLKETVFQGEENISAHTPTSFTKYLFDININYAVNLGAKNIKTLSKGLTARLINLIKFKENFPNLEMWELALWQFPTELTQKESIFKIFNELFSEAIQDLYNQETQSDGFNEGFFNSLIIDEAQDFSNDWLEQIFLCVSNNRKKNNIFIFLDDNQKINRYERHDNKSLNLGDIPTFSLPENLRNTKHIFNLSTSFYEGQKLECHNLDGLKISFVEANNIEEIYKQVIKSLEKLTEDGVKDIAILQGSYSKYFEESSETSDLYLIHDFNKDKKYKSSLYPLKENTVIAMAEHEKFLLSLNTLLDGDKNTLLDENDIKGRKEIFSLQNPEDIFDVHKKKAKINKYPVLPSYFNEYNKIIYDRIINFKGMEKEVVILVDIDESMDIGQDIYVGVSRAKAQLIIISGKTALNRLRDLAF